MSSCSLTLFLWYGHNLANHIFQFAVFTWLATPGVQRILCLGSPNLATILGLRMKGFKQ